MFNKIMKDVENMEVVIMNLEGEMQASAEVAYSYLLKKAKEEVNEEIDRIEGMLEDLENMFPESQFEDDISVSMEDGIEKVYFGYKERLSACLDLDNKIDKKLQEVK